MRIICINLRKVKRALVFFVGIVLYLCAIIVAGKLLVLVTDEIYAESASLNPKEGMVIVIDAGHGGEDSGAISGDGKMEKDLNLEIAIELGEQLKEKGYTVVFTRTTDKMLYSEDQNIKGFRKISDLKNRCIIANEYENSILISIHINSYGSESCSGLQVYYKSNDEQSRCLAEKIQSNTKELLQPNNKRVIKDGSALYILENTDKCAVLVECGFISNPAEALKLSEKEYQKQLSFSILCGIIEYIDQNNKA